jgi:hypothetical protein
VGKHTGKNSLGDVGIIRRIILIIIMNSVKGGLDVTGSRWGPVFLKFAKGGRKSIQKNLPASSLSRIRDL